MKKEWSFSLQRVDGFFLRALAAAPRILLPLRIKLNGWLQPLLVPVRMDHARAVQLFYGARNRAENDANNRVREAVLLGFFTGDPAFEDPVYTPLRTEFNAWLAAKKAALGLPPETPTVAQAGGGRKNADFSLDMGGFSLRPEFKYGATSLKAVPQFLSVAANRDWHQGESYAAFFYDTYLARVCAIYSVTHEMSREDYVARVHSDSYKPPLFAALYKAENEGTDAQKLEKKRLVDTSIREWLETVKDKTDLAAINEVLATSQKEKTYLLCKAGKFYSDAIQPEELVVTGVVGIRLGKLLVLQTATTTRLEMLLRWKNHAGVCFPAWQIKLCRQ